MAGTRASATALFHPPRQLQIHQPVQADFLLGGFDLEPAVEFGRTRT